jgi:hypothetical protein
MCFPQGHAEILARLFGNSTGMCTFFSMSAIIRHHAQVVLTSNGADGSNLAARSTRVGKKSPMLPSISHDWNEESALAKARWFRSLSVDERMQVFVEMTDLIIGLNPSILDAKDAKPIPGRVRVLELPRG